MATLEDFTLLGRQEQGLAVISTARADGGVQASLVNAGVHDDWDSYDRTMAEQHRAAVLVTPGLVYRNPQA